MGSFRSHQGMGVEKVEWVDIINDDYNANDNFMDNVKRLAKAVWAFCSYLFWPQKNKDKNYDTKMDF